MKAPQQAMDDTASDRLWLELNGEAACCAASEPILVHFLRDAVLRWNCWPDALAHAMARRLHSSECPPSLGEWRDLFSYALV
jgi:hypothetical protein